MIKNLLALIIYPKNIDAGKIFNAFDINPFDRLLFWYYKNFSLMFLNKKIYKISIIFQKYIKSFWLKNTDFSNLIDKKKAYSNLHY